MDKAHILCTHTHTHIPNVHTSSAVSKGFAWHVIRHLLHVTSCTRAYLAVEKAKVNASNSDVNTLDSIKQDVNQSTEIHTAQCRDTEDLIEQINSPLSIPKKTEIRDRGH